MSGWPAAAAALIMGYVVGSIPFAYIIVKLVVHDDITAHGTGNVGAMNVRRSTGSWGWFTVAMFCDAFKGMAPVALAKLWVLGLAAGAAAFMRPWGVTLADAGAGWASDPLSYLPMVAVGGAVFGHNYSLWMALIKRHFTRTGKGLATGGGALLIYDWRYFIAVVVIGLATIAITRYMMAGQVAAAWTLPATAWALHSPDVWFATLMGAVVYAAHHRRFVGMLKGREPKLYVNDRMGPRG